MSVLALLPDERHQSIREQLAARGRVLAIDLARELNASEDTVRRDLRELAARGECRRVYGGAVSVSPASRALSDRLVEHPERKAALARQAAKLVSPGQFVFIDAGSTNLAIARALPPDLNLVVATNAPAIALALLERGGIEILLVGGRLDGHAGSVLGAQAVGEIRAMSPDICFLGACAVDQRACVSAFQSEDAAFKRMLAERSEVIAAAVTNEKLATKAPFEVLQGADLDHLIVEHDARHIEQKHFDSLGIQIHRADKS